MKDEDNTPRDVWGYIEIHGYSPHEGEWVPIENIDPGDYHDEFKMIQIAKGVAKEEEAHVIVTHGTNVLARINPDGTQLKFTKE